MANTCPKCRADNPGTQKFCGECGVPLPSAVGAGPAVTETLQTPVKELTTGASFAGRYQVIEELGKGGMGRVYKVFDTKVKEKVALKLIRPDIAADPETTERFSNELKLARKIRHQNVCGMFDLGEADGTRFITMEYVSRRGPQEHDPDDGNARHRHRPERRQADLRRPGRGPPPGRRSPRPEAAEHHDRQGRERQDHGFRDRPDGAGERHHRRRAS